MTLIEPAGIVPAMTLTFGVSLNDGSYRVTVDNVIAYEGRDWNDAVKAHRAHSPRFKWTVPSRASLGLPDHY